VQISWCFTLKQGTGDVDAMQAMSDGFILFLGLNGGQSTRVARLISIRYGCCLFAGLVRGGDLSVAPRVVLLQSKSLLISLNEDGDAAIILLNILARI
jgi:hypothetical protein